MIFLNVRPEMSLTRECGRAKTARERLLTRVHSHVTHKVAPLLNHGRAVTALVRAGLDAPPVFSVAQLVPLQVRFVGESIAAKITPVRTVAAARVLLVSPQVCFLDECVVTDVAFVWSRLFGVRFAVLLQLELG